MDATSIVPIVTAILALLGSIYATRTARDASKEKNTAEAADTLTGNALKQVKSAQETADRAIARAETAEKRADAADARADKSESELREVKAQLAEIIINQRQKDLDRVIFENTMKQKVEHLESANKALTQRAEHAEKVVEELKKELAIERQRVTRLRNQLKAAGFKPDTGELDGEL